MLKILQSRLQQYVNCELPNVQAGFRKGKGTGLQRNWPEQELPGGGRRCHSDAGTPCKVQPRNGSVPSPHRAALLPISSLWLRLRGTKTGQRPHASPRSLSDHPYQLVCRSFGVGLAHRLCLWSNCQHPLDHQKSKRVPEKHLLMLYWLHQSLWLCGSQQTVENSLRDGNTRQLYLSLEKPVCRSRSND